MNLLATHTGAPLHGRVRVPGDKSISHRALLLGALAEGTSRVSGFLPCGDCLATLACLRALGVEIETDSQTALTIHGRGLRSLQKPNGGEHSRTATPLNCARSGTTMRLLAGIQAGQPFESALSGDEQVLHRPMRRLVDPLRRMGAEF